ncbi:hypothetical protein F5Y08DRAFT_305448 [Xylaria arbuscula]|uniref:Uncharacterized protein n=1 Tax=Xylaria arbuscula TaxID=114810 RepID=A0A9W8NBN3_9PEZI|nr:hypothetical protein F5Y08DRAFT_305448 [Xylaria arbuscula]KAJ3567056.1 hypothetical protein NPX13_g6905 [Xylaria arbuscula]
MRSSAITSWLCGSLLLALGRTQSIPSTSEGGQTVSTTDSTVQSSPVVSSTSDSGISSSVTTTQTSSDESTTTSSGSSSSSTSPPDVYLQVPELHVGKIELDVDDLNAELTLAAQIASLVEINAGVQVGISKVNITIAEVDAELELIVRLGNLVEIVNRTLTTLNLNPLLINVINEVTDLVDAVVGAVDGLLGSIVNGDSTINFIIDNLGNIVQEVVGTAGGSLSSIVGNYEQNMTYTGAQEILDGGLIQKTYSYSPLNALVNIVFNSLGQVVQAVVVQRNGSGGSSTTSSTARKATAAVRK